MLKIIKNHNSYKTGIDEIEGLSESMVEILRPVQEALLNNVYWNECSIKSTEYKSRDGFIPHSHNCGGKHIQVIIPKCEEYEFGFLDFGHCDHSEEEDCGYDPELGECMAEVEGHLDSALTILFKYEGFCEYEKKHQFYFCVHGGNADAPYFRTNYSTDIYDGELYCNSLNDLKKESQKHVEKIIKLIKAV